MAMKNAARREKRARAEVEAMTERGAEVRNANGAEIGNGKRAEAGKGNGAEAKSADAAGLGAEIEDSEAAIEVLMLYRAIFPFNLASTVLDLGPLLPPVS